MSTDLIGGAVGETPATELVSGAVGSHCANCQGPLASDQHYCLNCGQRRGKPRFPVMPVADGETAGAGATPRRPRQQRFSSAATLLAGIATLLMAMGVGVLIGHNGNAPQRASAPVSVVTAGSGGGSGGAASGASGGTSAGTSGGGRSSASATNPAQATKPSAAGKASLKHAKVVVVHLTPKIEKKAAAAATKVFGQSGNLNKNVTQQVGAACNGGAGCQNGKFTGNFFPGG